MRLPRFGVVIALLLSAGVSGEVIDASGDMADADSFAATDTPENTPPAGAQLRAAISADLIDLSRLRAALERPSPERTQRLTLREAALLALKNNPDIIIAAIEPDKAEAEMIAAQGEFDPVLQQNIMYTDASMSLDQQLRRFAGFSSMDSTSIVSETVLGGKLQHGTRYAVTFDLKFEETTFGGFQGEYGGQLGLTLTQPLLRGFGRDVNKVRIIAAGNLRDISEAQVQLAVLNILADTVKSYWDLVGAVEALRVHEDALRSAERLLAINEKRRDIGTAADIDVLQAKAGVAMRQSELIAAYARVSDAGDILKLALNLQDDGLFSSTMLIPTDRPNPDSPGIFGLEDIDAITDQGVHSALALRPEMRMSDLEIENAALEQERARNDMLPQFDVVGSYMRGGRAPGLGRTLSGIREEQDRTYGIGVQGSVALGNRAARGAHQRARLNKRQAEERRKKTEMSLMMGVHYAARAVMTNRALMESNRQTVRLQEANVAAEEKRLQLGVVASYQALRVQEDLTAAQVQELQARIAYEKSLVDYSLATGALPDELGIQQ